jgi:hypothetical protein
MSDIPYPPLTDRTAGITARLAHLRAQVAAWFWVDGLSRVLWLALGLFAADLAIDWLFRLDRAQRLVMLGLMLAALGWAIYRWLVRPLAATMTDDALALRVEAVNKQLGQGLISALQFARMADAKERGMSPTLVRQAVLSGVQVAQEVSFASVLDSRRFQRNSLLFLAAAAIVGMLGVGTLVAAPLRIWFARNVLLTNATWPQKTYLVIERVGENSEVVFPRGEDWTQLVSVTPESEVVPDSVYLDFRRTRGRSPLAMKRSSERQFEATFASVIEPFEFRARGGDAVTEWVRVELVEQPAVTELKLVVTPPKYTGGQAEELPPGRGPYYVLPGSSLALTATANKPLARAAIVIEGNSLPLSLADPLHFSGQFAAGDLTPGQYMLDLEDTLGITSRQPTTFALRRRVDREPRVRVKLIGVSGMVVPQARVPFTCRIIDDFGLTDVRVAYRWKGDDASQEGSEGILPVGQASRLPELSLDESLELAPLKIPTGSGLSFRFEAADNDDVSGPNIGRSSEFLVRIVTEEELRTDLLRREKEQRQEFERLAKNQEDLLTDSRAFEAAVKGKSDLTAEQKDSLLQYHKRQKLVGQNTSAIAERMSAIVIEVQNNRLEEAGGRLQTRLTKEIVEPLQMVAGELIPAAVASLDKTRRQAAAPAERDSALAETIRQQAAAVAKMKQILEHMVKSEGFQEAVNLLYEIQKVQTDVHEQTNKERQERIKRILEGGAGEKPADPPKP